MVDFNKQVFDKPEYKSRNKKFCFWISLPFFILLITLGVMFYLNSKEEMPKAPAQQESMKLGKKVFYTDSNDDFNSKLDLKFAALFRHVLADKICYDKNRNGFLLHFPKEIGERDNGESWHGWWFINHPDFNYVEENNTSYVFSIGGNEYRKVWPKVEGMACAESKNYDGK